MIIAKMLKVEGKYNEALKILEDKKDSYEKLSLNDKLKYNYDIAWLYWKTNNKLMYKYIEKNKELFSLKDNRKNYKISYAKFLSLYSNYFLPKLDCQGVGIPHERGKLEHLRLGGAPQRDKASADR